MPSAERELVDWMSRHSQMVDGRGTYQYPKLVETLANCKSFRTCIDQGSHIGLWTMHLAKRFDRVVCFEPLAHLRECWLKNMEGDSNAGNCDLKTCALGEHAGTVAMYSNPTVCGDSWISKEGDAASGQPFTAEMRTIDSFDFIDVDLIKCDAEGYEENILRGAEATIAKWRPTIVVEQKREMARKFGLEPKGAVEFLKTLDYVEVREMGGDHIMVPR
jgi:FkbM family methyltransferase